MEEKGRKLTEKEARAVINHYQSKPRPESPTTAEEIKIENDAQDAGAQLINFQSKKKHKKAP